MERDQASKFVNDLLRLMLARNGSDLFLTAEFPPAIKVDGKVTKVSPQPLTGQHTLQLARTVMNDKQAAEFERTKECNFAISPQGVGRFRVNAFMQQGQVGLVFRTIPATLPTIEGLSLPKILKDVAMTKRGLVIFVGATGSGKSTSLAAMVDHRNQNSFGHIITIEDPVEFVHPHKNCIVTQREVGIDTDGWEQALKNTLRQAPDVILMGEIRDRETMDHAVAFAETGHLCMATLHANSANQALDRIINPARPDLGLGARLTLVVRGPFGSPAPRCSPEAASVPADGQHDQAGRTGDLHAAAEARLSSHLLWNRKHIAPSKSPSRRPLLRTGGAWSWRTASRFRGWRCPRWLRSGRHRREVGLQVVLLRGTCSHKVAAWLPPPPAGRVARKRRRRRRPKRRRALPGRRSRAPRLS